MKKILTTRDVYQRLNQHLRTTSQREFARRIGVSDAYVSQVVNGQKGVNDRMLREIGLQRVDGFEEIT